jgi:plastocyanin
MLTESPDKTIQELRPVSSGGRRRGRTIAAFTEKPTMFTISNVLPPLLLATALLTVSAARADTIVVKGQGVRFVPEIVHARIGDTLAFRQMQTQSLESVAGMWPKSVASFSSSPHREVDFPIREEGVYVFMSPPHWKAHMGLVLVVGDQSDLPAVADRLLELASTDPNAKPAKRLLLKFRENLGK